MNAVVVVVTTSGKVNVYRNHTMMSALNEFFAAMDEVYADSSCIQEIGLYSRFTVTTDSIVYSALEARGLTSVLK